MILLKNGKVVMKLFIDLPHLYQGYMSQCMGCDEVNSFCEGQVEAKEADKILADKKSPVVQF